MEITLKGTDAGKDITSVKHKLRMIEEETYRRVQQRESHRRVGVVVDGCCCGGKSKSVGGEMKGFRAWDGKGGILDGRGSERRLPVRSGEGE